jgi:hypothetical protein
MCRTSFVLGFDVTVTDPNSTVIGIAHHRHGLTICTYPENVLYRLISSLVRQNDAPLG